MQTTNDPLVKKGYQAQISEAIKAAEDYLKQALALMNAEQVVKDWLAEYTLNVQKQVDQDTIQAIRTLESTKSKYKVERYSTSTIN